MADANGIQRAIRLTGCFNIKKMAADFCSAQCIMDNSGSLISLQAWWRQQSDLQVSSPCVLLFFQDILKESR